MWVEQNKMAPSVTQPYRKLRAKNEATLLRREQVFWKPHKIGNKESQ